MNVGDHTYLPLLLSGQMVKAVLDGRKTQTRRVVKPQPKWLEAGDGLPAMWEFSGYEGNNPKHPLFGGHGEAFTDAEMKDILNEGWWPCPYGKPGDWLWVRETWGIDSALEMGSVGCLLHNLDIAYRADGKEIAHHVPREVYNHYLPQFEQDSDGSGDIRWKPSIHMPFWASRIHLPITAVRAERLQDITEADAVAEGVGSPFTRDCKVPKFSNLWNSLNAKRGYGWSVNPRVWVITWGKPEVQK